MVDHERLSVRDDPDRVEEAYRRMGTNLWRALVAYSGDPDVATDAVAEAFAQAIRRGDQVRHIDGWVWKVAFRVAAGELKERSRYVRAEHEGQYEMPVDAVAMSALLQRLPPKQRAALILHYQAGLPNDEIARTLGVTTATVRVHLSQGRKRLKCLLEDDDDG